MAISTKNKQISDGKYYRDSMDDHLGDTWFNKEGVSLQEIKDLKNEFDTNAVQALSYLKSQFDDVLNDKNDIIKSTVSYLIFYLRCNTGYNAGWLEYELASSLKSGRPAKHIYEEHVACCKLIWLLVSKGSSRTQAKKLIIKIFGIHRDKLDSIYSHFEDNLENYIDISKYIDSSGSYIDNLDNDLDLMFADWGIFYSIFKYKPSVLTSTEKAFNKTLKIYQDIIGKIILMIRSSVEKDSFYSYEYWKEGEPEYILELSKKEYSDPLDFLHNMLIISKSPEFQNEINELYSSTYRKIKNADGYSYIWINLLELDTGTFEKFQCYMRKRINTLCIFYSQIYRFL